MALEGRACVNPDIIKQFDGAVLQLATRPIWREKPYQTSAGSISVAARKEGVLHYWTRRHDSPRHFRTAVLLPSDDPLEARGGLRFWSFTALVHENYPVRQAEKVIYQQKIVEVTTRMGGLVSTQAGLTFNEAVYRLQRAKGIQGENLLELLPDTLFPEDEMVHNVMQRLKQAQLEHLWR